MFAALVPVGPGQREVERLRDTLDSLRAFEDSREVNLVLVDDSEAPRDLAGAGGEWASSDVVRTPLWRDGTPDPYSAMVAGTIEGMRAAARHQPEFLLKLDTDALVIAPLADKLRRAFAEDGVGLVGSYTHTCTGARRDWSRSKTRLRGATRPVARGPGLTLRLRAQDARAVSRLLDRATDPGIPVGGPLAWVAPTPRGSRITESCGPARVEALGGNVGGCGGVMLGVLAHAGGLRIRGDVDPGGTFALAWQNLPLPPERLIEGGYSVVHSVRGPRYGDELQLRAWFRSHRPAPRPA